VDFDRPSERAFEVAITMVKALAGELEIVHVSAPPPPTVEDGTDSPEIAAVRERLGQLVRSAETQGVTAHGHLRLEAPVFALLQVIDETKPLFVVVGSHGRHGVGRAFFGSVSDELCRKSAVPVLVVATLPVKEQPSAWSCSDCGHIFRPSESLSRCAQCKTAPARWLHATIDDEAADIGEPSIGEPLKEMPDRETPASPTSMFATSVGGAAGGSQGTSVNPELRVRY